MIFLKYLRTLKTFNFNFLKIYYEILHFLLRRFKNLIRQAHLQLLHINSDKHAYSLYIIFVCIVMNLKRILDTKSRWYNFCKEVDTSNIGLF